MAVVANKRSIMTLYTDSTDIYSHQVRIVLAEKGIAVDIIPVDTGNMPEDFIDMNPYGTLPTLGDRDLVLYESRIIMEYLDERFPHPPLLPVYPVARAKSRLLIYRIVQDWYRLMHKIRDGHDEYRLQLANSLVAVNALFANTPYFMGEEFSLVDCVIAPLLWRLPELGIEIPEQAKGIIAYQNRIFERPSFQESLTELEREIRFPATEAVV